MCGLTCAFGPDIPDLEEFKAFNSSLYHRGPDNKSSALIDQNLLFGHTRLSIQDLTNASSQPMEIKIPGSDGHKLSIVFNGEIYNFLDIRSELVSLGHKFYSTGDTEVLLRAYLQWGKDCIYKFNGMWAFALFDSRDKILWLSRDRFGVKPLYLYMSDTTLFVASEKKAFFQLPLRYISPLRKNAYSQLVSAEKYIFNDSSLSVSRHKIFNFPPGCQMDVYYRSRVFFKASRWWDLLDNCVENRGSFDDQVAEFSDLLVDACRIRNIADVPLSITVSGGLDSSVVASISKSISDANNAKPRTIFTVDYKDTPNSEAKFVSEYCRFYGCNPVSIVLDISSFPFIDLEDSIFYSETIGESNLGIYMIYKRMRETGSVVCLGGSGADEYLGGYHHYALPSLFDVFDDSRQYEERRSIWSSVQDAGLGDGESAIGMPTFSKRALLDRPLRVSKNGYMKDIMDYSFFHDCRKNLAKQDFLSMASGVELRSPFMDFRVISFLRSLPTKSILGDGFTKRILRHAAFRNNWLPRSILTRKDKMGFATPFHSWLKSPGIQSYLLDLMRSQEFLDNSWFDGRLVSSVFEEKIALKNFSDAKKRLRFVNAYILLRRLLS